MDGAGAGFAILALLVIGVVIWIGSMSLDTDRIKAYVERRDGRIVSINWAPLGKGWFGEKNDRIYEVVYYDGEGKQHWATCKTSMFSGVYWTEDRIAHPNAKWYRKLPPRNEPGNPFIRHLQPRADDQQDEEDVASDSERDTREGSTAESLDEEMLRLRKRLAELERKKRERGD